MIEKIKFPRIFHVPSSQGITTDDKKMKDYEVFFNKEVVITEKLDGENTTMTSDSVWARSLDSRSHESRDWVRSLHGQLAHKIKGYRLHGENMFAKHSINYTDLTSYFYLFGISKIDTNTYLSWDDVNIIAEYLGLITVPVWFNGFHPEVNNFCNSSWMKKGSEFSNEVEGYTIRLANDFTFNQDSFNKSIAKFVRANHAQSSNHWMNSQLIKNNLTRQL